MTCLSAVTRSMYADDALPPEQVATVVLHLRGCPACSAKVASLRAERVALRAALQTDETCAKIPVFVPPARSRDLLVLTLGVLAVAAVAGAFWTAVAEAIPSGMQWLNPFQSGELAERAITFIAFFLNEGHTMLTSALNVVAATLAVALLAWTTLSLARGRGSAALLVSLLVAAVALPRPGHAIEIRRGEGVITVAAGETIDDSLIAAGQTVAIDGTVNGDLLAFGRTVTIRGNVTGNVITGAESVTIEGTVGGDIVGAGRGVTLRGTRVGRNFFGFGRDLDIDAGADVAGNALTFGETAHVDGRVGMDLKSFGANVLVSGNVQRDFEAYAGEVSVLPSGRIGRNVTAHIDADDKLLIAQGATIGGATNRQIVEREQRRNRYLTTGFYVRQVVRIGAAFLTGLLLLWAFPVLRTLVVADGRRCATQRRHRSRGGHRDADRGDPGVHHDRGHPHRHPDVHGRRHRAVFQQNGHRADDRPRAVPVTGRPAALRGDADRGTRHRGHRDQPAHRRRHRELRADGARFRNDRDAVARQV